MPVALHIVNDVSYVMWINHELYFAWQVQYLVKLEVMPVALHIVNDVAYAMRINHELHFAWQAQNLLKLEAAFCCSAHCKFHM